jgi:hypothetical protein
MSDVNRKFLKLDADESVFFGRQLEHLKSKTYDKKFTNLKARQVIPVSFEAGPGAETITYEQFDMVGMAKIVRDYAEDFRAADVTAKEFVAKVKSLGSAYKYSVQDVRAARQAGKSLEQRKANAAKRAIDQLENKIAYFGDDDHGLVGMLNNANVPIVGLPHAGAWSTLTADQLIDNLNANANNAITASNGVESPNTMLLPTAEFTLISSKRIPDTNITVKDFFLSSNPFIEQIDWLEELKAAGVGAVPRIVSYRRDPDWLTLEIPQDFEQFAVQEQGLAFKVPCHERIAGVLNYYPLAMAYSDIS